MTLRKRLLGSPETISDLSWAAEQRFQESRELLRAGRFAGSLYLAGLSCEMWLKVAGFRAMGNGPATTVASQLGPAKIWMKGQMPSIHPESYHSLLFWVEYLIRRRSSLHRALSRELVGQLRHHVINRLFEDWKLDVRYYGSMPTETHARRVLFDASWVRSVRDDLWS